MKRGPTEADPGPALAVPAAVALSPVGLKGAPTLHPSAPQVGLETYKSLCIRSRPVEAHAFVPEWEPRISGGTEIRHVSGRAAKKLHNINNTTTTARQSWQLPERLYQCRKENWPEPCGDAGFDNYRSRPLPELSDLRFSQVRLLAHDAHTQVPLASFPDGSEVPTLVTDGLLFKTNATTPPFARNVEAVLGTLGSFRWASTLQATVDDYVEAQFGTGPFVAIHWRRGYSDNVFHVRSAEEVADQLLTGRRKLQEETGDAPTANFYIASNQLDDADLQRVSARLNISDVRLHSLLLEPSQTASMGVEELSRVEQGICSQAAIFIGTPMSTWSANVDAFRGLYSLRMT